MGVQDDASDADARCHQQCSEGAYRPPADRPPGSSGMNVVLDIVHGSRAKRRIDRWDRWGRWGSSNAGCSGDAGSRVGLWTGLMTPGMAQHIRKLFERV